MKEDSVVFSPATSSVLPIQRKASCACGGGCPACQSKLPIQTKLTISEPGDIYEQEADRMAEHVTAAPAPPVVSSVPPHIQRDTGLTSGNAIAAPSSVDHALSSPGSPLDSSLQKDMGQHFGYDFSQVRVHTGAAAAQSAREIGADAYTAGSDIVFGADQHSSGSQEGRRLIAHELTHVVQQSEFARPYRNKNAFNFGKADDSNLIEDSFNIRKDKETKPWIELITVEFTSKDTDEDGDIFWQGTATVQYYGNPVKRSDFSLPVAGGLEKPLKHKTDPGEFIVHRIEGVGYNSGKFSGTEGVDYEASEREGPRKRYSKDLDGNMNFAVFYNKGEALHSGPIDYGSHGCVHVDWADETNMKQLNYHSVIGLTKVVVKYSAPMGDFPLQDIPVRPGQEKTMVV